MVKKPSHCQNGDTLKKKPEKGSFEGATWKCGEFDDTSN